jgi:hypothetical protein
MARSTVIPRLRAPAAAATLAFGLVVGALSGAGPAAAADPSGSPAASGEAGEVGPQIEIWQDQPLPPDVPVGRTLDVGFTAWDATGKTLGRVNGAQVRIHPKTGKAKPIEAFSRSDWPGHLVAPITIPDGGLGTIEIGFTGRECHDDTGTCKDIFAPFQWGGVGPPPDAPRSLLVEASIQPPVEPVLTGVPFDVVAEVTPRADWGADGLALPAQLVLVARAVRGSSFSMADLNAEGDGPYRASMTIPDVGDVVLIVGFPRDGADPDLVEASITRVSVQSGRAAQAASPSARAATTPTTAPAGDSIPVVPIVLALVVLIAGGVVVTRALADL